MPACGRRPPGVERIRPTNASRPDRANRRSWAGFAQRRGRRRASDRCHFLSLIASLGSFHVLHIPHVLHVEALVTGRAFFVLLVVVGAAQSGALRFEPVDPDRLSAGATFLNAWADFDGDDDLDLFVGMGSGPNRLYRNDKGVLTDVAAAVGVADARATRAAAWGDADADGDPDLLVGFTPGAAPLLKIYRNDQRAVRRRHRGVRPGGHRGRGSTDGVDGLRLRRRPRSVRRLSRQAERAVSQRRREADGRRRGRRARRSAQDRRRRVVRLRLGRRPRPLRRQHGRRCERVVPQRRRQVH